MADITHNDSVVTESKLKDFYEDIKPFLGCPAYLTSEGNAEYYSTDEKVIGRWIDGKPLYQKTISPSSAYSAGTHNIATGLTGIDKMVEIKAVQINNSTGDTFALDENSNDYIGFIGEKLVYTKTSTGVTWKVIATIKYTKIADSASTTTQSDPNEYSTDEKIIGKWIDGKPLYQKSFSFRATNGWTTIDSSGDHSTWEMSMLKSIFIATSDGSFFGGNNSYGILINMPSAICGNSNFRVYCPSFSKNNVDSYITVQYTKTTD